MIVNKYLNIRLVLMLLFSTSVNTLLIYSAGCCKCCKGENNDGNGKAIKQKKLEISIGGDGKKINEVTLDGNSIKQGNWDVDLANVEGIVHKNFNNCASVVKIGKDIFESITTDFNNLKVNINDETIEKYLCAVVANKPKKDKEELEYYIVFSTESTNGSGVSTYGLFENSKNYSIYVLRSEGLESLHSLFETCSILKELNLFKLNTEKVTDMSRMFRECSSLKELNLSNFNTEKVDNNMALIFDECVDLNRIIINKNSSEDLKTEIKDSGLNHEKQIVGTNLIQFTKEK